MKTFKELKDFIISEAKNSKACKHEFKTLLKANTKKELLEVVKDNFYWCNNYAPSIISIDILDNFGEKLCHNSEIYYKGCINEVSDSQDLIMLHSVEVEFLINSSVGHIYDNSRVGHMRKNSSVNAMFGNSRVGNYLKNKL